MFVIILTAFIFLVTLYYLRNTAKEYKKTNIRCKDFLKDYTLYGNSETNCYNYFNIFLEKRMIFNKNK